jgi:hypothetical protein
MQHVAVEPGGDLLFDGAVEAVADGVFHALFGDFGDVAEVDLVVGQGGKRRKLRFLAFGQRREIVEVELLSDYFPCIHFQIDAPVSAPFRGSRQFLLLVFAKSCQWLSCRNFSS